LSSALIRALRVSGLVVTLLSLLVLASVAYSLYAEFRALGSGAPLSVEQRTTPEGFSIRVAGKLPNEGLYPLSLRVTLRISAEGKELASAASPPLDIGPGSEGQLELSMTLNPLSSSNASLLKKLLLNGSELDAELNFSLAMRPLASALASGIFRTPFPPPMGNLSVGVPRIMPQDGRLLLSVPISFVNYSPLSYSASFYGVIMKQGSELAKSDSVSVQALPGQRLSFALSFALSRAPAAPPYLLQLYIQVKDKALTIPVEVGG
jgi:hypothetical protein